MFALCSATIATAQQAQAGTPLHLPVGIAKMPDLKPDLTHPHFANGVLTVKIRNVGTGNAPASSTMLSYTNESGVIVQKQYTNTPAIPAGGFVEIKFKYPYTKCEHIYTVTADAANTIKEASEANNHDDNCDVD